MLAVALTGSAYANEKAPEQPQAAPADTSATVRRLEEVTVRADEIISTPDKMIVQVSQQVRRNSYDGYSALRLMTIPGVEVDIRKSSVTANGQKVLLCINGIEADEAEIKTLNPKDIIRVDFYTNFDPRHPMSDYVMDFIMKIRDSGGAFAARLGQNLNKSTGSQMADWRTFRGKTEMGVRLTGNYDHFGHGNREHERFSMLFPQGVITRTNRTIASPKALNRFGSQFTLLHRWTHGVMKASVSLGTGHNRSTDIEEMAYSNEPEPVRAFTLKHSDQLYPSFKVSYDHNIQDRIKLQFGLSGQYTHTDASRLYSSYSTLSSATHESYYSLKPKAQITMNFGKKWNVFASAHYFYNNSRQHYREEGKFEPSYLVNGQLILAAGVNSRLTSALSVSLRLQERIVTTDPGTGRNTSSYITPALTVSYSMPRSNRIQASVFSGVFNPELSYYSTNEKQIDEYLVATGNPDLKLMKPVVANISFTSTHRWGHFRFTSSYENTARSIYNTYTFDPERMVYVRSFVNGGHYETFYANVSTMFNVIPDKLKLSFLGCYMRDKLRGWKLMEKDCFIAAGRIIYTNGGFSATASLRSNMSGISRSGEYYRTPVELSLSAGYATGGWSFNLDVVNPFIKATELNNFRYGGVSWNTVRRNPRSDYNYVGLTVSYRFSYGKKHKFENVDADNTPGSAILSH